MVDQVLLNYVKNCLKEGYHVDRIIKELIENGYRKDEIVYTLKYLQLNDPSIDDDTILQPYSNFKKEEEEQQKRNLVNLIENGYTPVQIEKDLITSGMTPEKALETVITLIPPYKEDKISFITFYIKNLKNLGFTLEHIKAALKKQKVSDYIIRNIGNEKILQEIIENYEVESQFENYELGVMQRLYTGFLKPKILFMISKYEKNYRPLIEVLRIQVTILIFTLLLRIGGIYYHSRLDLNSIDWSVEFNILIDYFINYLMIISFQFSVILASALLISLLTTIIRERLSFFDSLKVSAYSYIPQFVFYIIFVSTINIDFQNIPFFIVGYTIFTIWRMYVMLIGLDYFLHSQLYKLAAVTLIVGASVILGEVLLGYWDLIY